MNINDLGFPFTSISGDRQYSASEWRRYFETLVTGGIIGDIANELKVNPQVSPNKTIFIDTGAVMINGAVRDLITTLNLTCSDNTSGNPRRDRVVARLNYTDRKIEFAIKQGTPAVSPVAPSLTQNTTTWEYALADIALANGYSTIVAGNITDKREDETVCGYFKYRAKPAWYPNFGVPSREAWMYTNFKNLLTTQEISDIETNSTLMEIIKGGIKQDLQQLGLFSAAFNYLSSNTIISVDTTLSENVNVYNNLTINAGITLTTRPGTTYIFVKGTLTLNGIISANGKGGTGGVPGSGTTAGSGGAGGGVIVLFARNITGTGTISANGINGTNTASGSASTVEGCVDGAGGSFRGITINAATDSNAASMHDINKLKKTALFSTLIQQSDIGGGGGPSGSRDDTSTYNSSAPSGGNGTIGQGGAGRTGTVASNNSTAGGGGGGGVIIILCLSSIPALALQAKGGDAGLIVSQTNANAAGGGGGGLISIIGISNLATTVVTGGTGGPAGYSGSAGSNGGAGLVEFYELA